MRKNYQRKEGKVQSQVRGWSFWGGNSFGITLLPMLFGVGILFWNGKNWLGWLLSVGGALFILAGIIANMHIYFTPPVFRDHDHADLTCRRPGFDCRSLRSHDLKQS